MFRPLKITFHMDGSGVIYDPSEPIHLDSLLAFSCAAHHGFNGELGRDDIPDDIPIPVGKWQIGDHWGWCASALFPDDHSPESIQFWRKKFRQNRIELTKGSPVLTNASYREYNFPMQLTLCHKMTAYAFGDRRNILRELKRSIKHLGKKASMGKGVVNDVTIDVIDNDYSLFMDGFIQRWFPSPDGMRQCRIRPPYWNRINRTSVMEIGEQALPDLIESIKYIPKRD